EIDARIASATAADPAIPTLVTTSVTRAAQNGVKNISLYAPVINWMDDKDGQAYAGSQRANYGPVVWWYQSCMSFGCSGVAAQYSSGWPSYAVDTDGSRNRAMEWL